MESRLRNAADPESARVYTESTTTEDATRQKYFILSAGRKIKREELKTIYFYYI